MPDDTTEGVAEHSSRLQPSINLHAPVIHPRVTLMHRKIRVNIFLLRSDTTHTKLK